MGLLLAMCTVAFAQTESIAPAVTEDGIAVYFSPGNNITEVIIHELGQAKATVDVQVYSFTSARIAEALLEAKKRGVRVRVVLDKSQTSAQYSSATFFHNQSVPCFIDSSHAIAHNKVMIIDSSTVITGSFNFTKAAEKSNAENLLIIRGKAEITNVYAANFGKWHAFSCAAL